MINDLTRPTWGAWSNRMQSVTQQQGTDHTARTGQWQMDDALGILIVRESHFHSVFVEAPYRAMDKASDAAA